MPKLDHDTLELLLIAVAAICILFQTVLLSSMFFAVRKGIKSLTEQVDDLRSSAMPIIQHTRGFMERVTPTVEQTAKNVADISQSIKENTAKVSASASEIVERVNVQSSRVNTMISSALDAVDNAASFVAVAVDKPIRQFSGLLASVKAIVETLGASQPSQRTRPTAARPVSRAASGPADEAEPEAEPVL